MYRRAWLLGAMVAPLIGGAAVAADLPVHEPAPAVVSLQAFSWTGAYVGAQGGYDWFRSEFKANGGSATVRPDGFTVGAFAGYNYQLPSSPLVIGLEADLNYSDASGSRSTGAFGPPIRARVESEWTGSVTGRLGYAFDRFMIYGVGGLALADRDTKVRGGVAGSDDSTMVGWTVGGGVSAAVTDNVTARVEYRYSDYGTDTFSVAGNRVKADVTDNRVLLGLGYKFSGW